MFTSLPPRGAPHKFRASPSPKPALPPQTNSRRTEQVPHRSITITRSSTLVERTHTKNCKLSSHWLDAHNFHSSEAARAHLVSTRRYTSSNTVLQTIVPQKHSRHISRPNHSSATLLWPVQISRHQSRFAETVIGESKTDTQVDKLWTIYFASTTLWRPDFRPNTILATTQKSNRISWQPRSLVIPQH